MNRRNFLKKSLKMVTVGGLASGFCSKLFAETKEKPNIIFIFSDDTGWGDLGCYGNRKFKTPNLDKMAEEGTLFTQFYSSGSVCSPSRTAFITGQFPAKLGIHGHLAKHKQNKKRNMPNFLDPEALNLPTLLQKNGYTTGHFGKWHLGHGTGAPAPSEYGFDETISVNSNDPNQMDIWSPEARPTATKKVMDATFDFVKKHKNEPFYAQAWLSDTHATLNPSEEQMDVYSEYWWSNPAHLYDNKELDYKTPWEIYGGTLTEMDKQIGNFLDKLKKEGVEKNTIVIFSSDNGPEDFYIGNASHSGIGHAHPFRGRKRSIYEGGIRVPFIVKWPEDTPAGKVNNESVIGAVDFLPTICSIAGIEIPKNNSIDGEDMSAAIKGKEIRRSKPLMWEWGFKIFGHPLHKSPQLAIREGDHKLLINPDRSRVELYNIIKDPMEVDNIAKDHPELVKKLSKKVLDWKKTLPEVNTDPEAGKNDYPWPGK